MGRKEKRKKNVGKEKEGGGGKSSAPFGVFSFYFLTS